MDKHFSNVQHIIKPGQKPVSFSSHYDKHFKFTTAHTYLNMCMGFKLVKHINNIGEMKTFTKPNFSLCIDKRLTVLKNIRGKCVIIMNKNLDIYKACRNNKNFHRF